MKQFLVGILTLSLLGFSTPTQAQDAKANAILEKVSANFKKMSSLKAKFSLTANDASGKPRDTRTGTFMMKGNKYKVKLAAQEIICDAKNIWTYLPGNKEVQVSNYNPEEQTISPEKLFAGSYTKEYKSRYLGVRSVKGKKVDVIELTPIDGGKGMQKVQLFVDKAANMVTGGNLFERNGSSYTYMISDLNNANISDAEFTFDVAKHPGVEVIDLR